MRFSTAAILAFAGAAVAQTSGFDAITSPGSGASIAAGSTTEIDWDPTESGTVSIFLLGGSSPSTLELLSTIATNVTNSLGKYDWAVPTSVGTLATYGLKISLDSDPTTFQYSFPFKITGGTASSSSASASASGAGSSNSTASTTSSASTTSAPTTTAAALTTSAPPAGNLSTTAAPTKTLTTFVSATASKSATGSASVASSAANSVNVGASSLALLGGLAMAVFAL